MSPSTALVAVLTSWVPYALCAAGLTAMLLTQTAYQTGLPKVSLPIITVADPLVSCGIGVALFGEALRPRGACGRRSWSWPSRVDGDRPDRAQPLQRGGDAREPVGSPLTEPADPAGPGGLFRRGPAGASWS